MGADMSDDASRNKMTQKEREHAYACAALWAFGVALDTIEEWKNQKVSWVQLSNRIRSMRDMFKQEQPDAYPIQAKPMAEYIPAVNLFYTDNGNKTRLDKCKAILNDPQHSEFHGAIRKAQLIILEKKVLPADLDNMVARLYNICAE